jgi:hypothetical protein
VAVLLAGLAGGVVWLRRRPTASESAAPLTPVERDRLDLILRETDR